MSDKTSVVPIERIEKTILVIRGQKVMLDADLASLYGVTTKRLNEQVKRNRDRFPKDFMFELTIDEKEQVVAICDHLQSLKFSPAFPWFPQRGKMKLRPPRNKSITNGGKPMTKNEPKPKALPADAIAKYFEAKLQAEWGPHDVKKHREAGPQQVIVLDVRDKESYAQEHIQGAINIPLDELPKRAKELSKDKDIVTYCWTITCSLAPRAALWLAQKGYKVHELVGGIGTWKEYKLPIESRDDIRTPALVN